MQKSSSIQPRTRFSKSRGDSIHLFIRLLPFQPFWLRGTAAELHSGRRASFAPSPLRGRLRLAYSFIPRQYLILRKYLIIREKNFGYTTCFYSAWIRYIEPSERLSEVSKEVAVSVPGSRGRPTCSGSGLCALTAVFAIQIETLML